MPETKNAPQPGSLTDAQAVRALRLFYELSPAAAWEGGRKPSPERLKTLAAGLAEKAPADLRPALTALLDDEDPAGASARAALARVVLEQGAASPEFAPAAAHAMETAVKPEMAVDAVTAGLVLSLALGISHIKFGSFEFESRLPKAIHELRLPELLDKLPAVLKALPSSVWDLLHRKV
jgi:hypothetical protein